MIDISIIIVTYNTLQMTKECIDSIFEKTKHVSFEVILVDNASSDGSKEFFTQDKRIKYIYSNQNLGFGKANNLGFTYTSGKYIFLLNSDTLLLNNAIKHMFDFFEQEDLLTGCIGCLLYDNNQQPIHSWGTFPNKKIFLKRIINFLLPNTLPPWDIPSHKDQYPKEVDYITGADLMIRRNVIEQYGLFDPEFFMYFEETEMQYRYAKAGYKRIVINTGQIKHIVGASYKRKKHSLAGIIREMKSRYIYCRKVLTTGEYHTIALMHLLMIPRILICRAPWNEKSNLIKLILFNL